MNPTHVGVTYGACEKELLAKGFIVTRHTRFFADDLEGYGLLRASVVRQKYFAHAALAERLANLITLIDKATRTEGRGSFGLLHCPNR